MPLKGNFQLSLSDQLYRQSKIDEENRRLKKKSKADAGSSKKGKKASKKFDSTTINDNDEDVYPVIEVTRGGELPEGATESGNETDENDKFLKKNDPHRALNIDLNEKSLQKPASLSAQKQEPITQSIEDTVGTTEKPRKVKKKREDAQESTSKTKHRRERNDYKELLSPNDDEKNLIVPPTGDTTIDATPSTVTEKRSKKKKTKEKKKPTMKPSTNDKASSLLLFDIMSDDINPMNASNQNNNGQNIYKLVAQSDHLTIVSSVVILQEKISFSFGIFSIQFIFYRKLLTNILFISKGCDRNSFFFFFRISKRFKECLKNLKLPLRCYLQLKS